MALATCFALPQDGIPAQLVTPTLAPGQEPPRSPPKALVFGHRSG